MAVVFGSFQLAADARRLTRGGIPLHLTPKAFDLLVLLVDAAPRVVPKSELHARLWPDSFVADTTLVGLVKEVRRVLDDIEPGAPIIRTVNRVGYAFAAPLMLAPPAVATPAHWLVADGRSFPLLRWPQSHRPRAAIGGVAGFERRVAPSRHDYDRRRGSDAGRRRQQERHDTQRDAGWQPREVA